MQKSGLHKNRFASISVMLIILYIFTYGIWIQLYGLNNPYRYLVYILVIVMSVIGYLVLF